MRPRGRERLNGLRAVAASAALLAGLCQAASTSRTGASQASDEPLDPEEAFPVSAVAVKDRAGAITGIDLRFRIEPGYYLYRDRFRIDAPGLRVGTPKVPAGIEKDDPFVGRSRIFRKAVTLRVPLMRAPPAGEYAVHVTAQGCAEDRVCYAPFTQTRRIVVP